MMHDQDARAKQASPLPVEHTPAGILPARVGMVSEVSSVQIHTMPTPIGPLTLLAQDGVVLAGGFTEDLGRLITGRLRRLLKAAQLDSTRDLGPSADALEAYFAGELAALDTIAVQYSGAPFQRRVWDTLRAVPPGRPTTYREIAIQLGGERLARAVGMGCATNLISPVIPCHRLTHGDGGLAGYAWGLDRKRWLLDHERRYAPR